MFNKIEENAIIQRLEFLNQKKYAMEKTEYSIDYRKDNTVVSVFSGKHGEREDIIITQQNYYNYMSIKNYSFRSFFMTVFGVHRVYRLREMLPSKLRKRLSGLSRIERIIILADYLENNLDLLINKPPRTILAKYHF